MLLLEQPFECLKAVTKSDFTALLIIKQTLWSEQRVQMKLSQSVGLMFCRLSLFPSCLPIFGSVPVLISSLSNYKLITFVVSTCRPLIICPILVPVLWVLVCRLLLMCVCWISSSLSHIKWIILYTLLSSVTIVFAQHRDHDRNKDKYFQLWVYWVCRASVTQSDARVLGLFI